MLTAQEKENITTGFKAAGERIGEVEENTKAAIQELKLQKDMLLKQLRLYSRNLLDASMAQGSYAGFWRDEEQAKEFGELVYKVVRRKAMGETVDSTGGVLVPEELAAMMIQKLGQYGKYRANTMVVPIGADRLDVPKMETDLVVYSPGEGRTIGASDIEFSQVGLNAVMFACLAVVSNLLMEDAIMAVGEILGTSVTRSMAKKEDYIGFAGDGTETYFGMTGIIGALRGVDATIGNIKGLQVGTGNAYSELSLDDFEGVISILPDDADDGAKWYVNRKFFFSVMHKLARAAGAADMFNILTPQKVRYFMGYPVEFVSSMPSTEDDSQICALLGDLRLGSFLGQRKGIVVDQSEHRYFESNQTGFRGIERVAISVYGVGDTTEAGPIVGLITAAA